MTDRTPTVGDAIKTAEELDALPERTIIRSDDGAWEKASCRHQDGYEHLVWVGSFTEYEAEEVLPRAGEPPLEVAWAPGQDPHADRDRARSIAVTLEQEVAEKDARIARLEHMLGASARERSRLRAEAEAAHGIIEQVGLLQEDLAQIGIGAGEALREILDGATFEEVRRG